jgi:hypothetical protein
LTPAGRDPRRLRNESAEKAVFGAALGFTVGALIGGQIRKGEPDPESAP